MSLEKEYYLKNQKTLIKIVFLYYILVKTVKKNNTIVHIHITLFIISTKKRVMHIGKRYRNIFSKRVSLVHTALVLPVFSKRTVISYYK